MSKMGDGPAKNAVFVGKEKIGEHEIDIKKATSTDVSFETKRKIRSPRDSETKPVE